MLRKPTVTLPLRNCPQLLCLPTSSFDIQNDFSYFHIPSSPKHYSCLCLHYKQDLSHHPQPPSIQSGRLAREQVNEILPSTVRVQEAETEEWTANTLWVHSRWTRSQAEQKGNQI